ncbi:MULTISPECIES: imelysin family protein [Rhodomicrobium]|uniref:imelysin family protein n=1 Tax=Rhodomicrobium TaxID=1068 RepID=UPI000B4A7E12|nr:MULTISPECIES: imelysin family protein [Rhodomicrobium]
MRALLGLLILAAGMGTASARTIGEKAVENHIRPAYQRLATAMADLSTATNAYCAGGGDRAALDAAFKQAVLGWSGVEHLRFGPMLADNRFERFMFWPDPKSLGRKQLNAALAQKDQTVLSPATLGEKSVALQGLTAFEALMWSGDAEGVTASTPEDQAFACQFAKSIAAHLTRVAAAVRDEWAVNDGFAANLTAPGPEKLYHNDKEVTLELFKAFTTGLQQTRNAKLNRVLMGNPQEARPRRAAFWRSGNAVASIEANIEAIEDLYRNAGLGEIVKQAGTGEERSTLDQFDLIEKALDGLTGTPIADVTASKPSWEKLNSVVFGLINIQVTGGQAIVTGAALPMSFNALDGD